MYDDMRGWKPEAGDLLEVYRSPRTQAWDDGIQRAIVVEVYTSRVQVGAPLYALDVLVDGHITHIRPPYNIFRVLPKNMPRGQRLDNEGWLHLGVLRYEGWRGWHTDRELRGEK